MSKTSPDAVFAALWITALREVSMQDLAGPDSVRRLARRAGIDAFGCVAATTMGDDAALLRRSAALLSTVTLLWAAVGIEPDEIWMELHKRERLGSLLHDMTTGEGRPKRRAGQPWRVDSTKLP